MVTKEGDDFELKEKKTGKSRQLTLNKSVVEAVQALLAAGQHDDDHTPLFCSQRGNKGLTVPSIHRLVKGWCEEINLKGNYGSHSLRKTFGYQHRIAGTSIPELMTMFNHSTQKQTLDYLCVQAEEIKSAYLRLTLCFRKKPDPMGRSYYTELTEILQTGPKHEKIMQKIFCE